MLVSPAGREEEGQGHDVTVKTGVLFPIGGAEDRSSSSTVLGRFVALAGGSSARISILPTASESQDLGQRYQDVFRGLGVKNPRVLPLYLPEEANDPVSAEALSRSTGIFLTGGDQNRIIRVFENTLAFAAMLKAWRRGAVIGGTSAGASAMSDPMIAGGSGGGLPYPGIVQLKPGLGLTREMVIDQHFRERDRLGRLIAAIGITGRPWGLGLDEDTGAVLGPAGMLEVVGKGTATILDGRKLKVARTPAADSGTESSKMGLSGLKLHSLEHGQRFDLKQGSIE